MAAGKIRSVVATAALELGIDWGDVDLVIQVAAPKGVSRLLQRVGRSNHRLDVPSRAFLVPANRFEALECRAALTAIEQGQLDGEAPGPGSLDVVVQHILSCACSAPVDPDALFDEIRTALPYAQLDRARIRPPVPIRHRRRLCAARLRPLQAADAACRMAATGSPTPRSRAGTGRISASSSRPRGSR